MFGAMESSSVANGKGQTRISSCKYTKTKITVGKNTVTAIMATEVETC